MYLFHCTSLFIFIFLSKIIIIIIPKYKKLWSFQGYHLLGQPSPLFKPPLFTPISTTKSFQDPSYTASPPSLRKRCCVSCNEHNYTMHHAKMLFGPPAGTIPRSEKRGTSLNKWKKGTLPPTWFFGDICKLQTHFPGNHSTLRANRRERAHIKE